MEKKTKMIEKIRKELSGVENSTEIMYNVRYSLLEENKDPEEVYKNYKNIMFSHEEFKPIVEKFFIIDNFLDKPFECNEGSEKCVKCGSNKTISYNKATRAMDEGLTVFVFCVNCKHRAVFNS